MGPAQTFGYTGSEQVYVVPDGVVALHVVAVGAPGGLVDNTPYPPVGDPGMGAVTTADIPVQPGTSLYVEVGGVGGTSGAEGSGGSGGFDGGGPGGGGPSGGGGGGGGASGCAHLLHALPHRASPRRAPTIPAWSWPVGAAARRLRSAATPALPARAPPGTRETTQCSGYGGAGGTLTSGGQGGQVNGGTDPSPDGTEGAAGAPAGPAATRASNRSVTPTGASPSGAAGAAEAAATDGGGGGSCCSDGPLTLVGGGGGGGSSFAELAATGVSYAVDSTGTPSVSVTPLANPALAGQPVTYTATVSPAPEAGTRDVLRRRRHPGRLRFGVGRYHLGHRRVPDRLH